MQQLDIDFSLAVDRAMKVWFGERLDSLESRAPGRPALVVEDPRLPSVQMYQFQDAGMVFLVQDELAPLQLLRVEEVGDGSRYLLPCSRSAPQAVLDPDLDRATLAELQEQVMTLRRALREHRDAKGHDRCWLNDEVLYRLLPEGSQVSADLRLPPRDEFLRRCAEYHAGQSGCDGEHR